MKIVFMGTPDFSVPTLKALVESRHEVIACYTQPDKPKGRGNVVTMTPVKEFCLEHHIPVYQPKRIKREEEVSRFSALGADLAVVIAYGQILSKELLDAPKYGCMNIHASLLPKYRGAAPYQWAVIQGEKISGVTTMYMDEGMDTGDMLLTSEILLEEKETAGSLHDKLMLLGGDLILKTIDDLEAGTLKRIPQDPSLATHAPLLDKNYGKIRWDKKAEEIERLIRGLNPWPSAFTYLDGNLLKIWAAEVIDHQEFEGRSEEMHEGTILAVLPKEGFVVKCNQSALLIREVQLQGKKRMDCAAFLRGYAVHEGSILE